MNQCPLSPTKATKCRKGGHCNPKKSTPMYCSFRNSAISTRLNVLISW
uniref:Uncharacterized protein n=1 Tax=Arundo donax TaxID=35708 RepID=A0A0A9CTH2_ARUDO